jgi:hypothetical protein
VSRALRTRPRGLRREPNQFNTTAPAWPNFATSRTDVSCDNLNSVLLIRIRSANAEKKEMNTPAIGLSKRQKK